MDVLTSASDPAPMVDLLGGWEKAPVAVAHHPPGGTQERRAGIATSGSKVEMKRGGPPMRGVAGAKPGAFDFVMDELVGAGARTKK